MFLTKADLLPSIRTNRLDQITDADDSILDLVFAETQSDIYNFLFEHYDADSILNATGDARNATVLGWAKYMAIYKVYERVPDNQVPARVVKDYQATLELLKSVSTGEVAMGFPRRPPNAEGGTTQFRWTSARRLRNKNR